MTLRTSYADIPAWRTLDGSEIRELCHPAMHGNRNQSLAEAIVEPGQSTRLHLHRTSEELYHVLAGCGVMTLGAEQFPVRPGDTVLIDPGTPHRITADGPEPLRLLCCCSVARPGCALRTKTNLATLGPATGWISRPTAVTGWSGPTRTSPRSGWLCTSGTETGLSPPPAKRRPPPAGAP